MDTDLVPRRFADGLTPGRSLWYARLAFERMVQDELEPALDPKAASSNVARSSFTARCASVDVKFEAAFFRG